MYYAVFSPKLKIRQKLFSFLLAVRRRLPLPVGEIASSSGGHSKSIIHLPSLPLSLQGTVEEVNLSQHTKNGCTVFCVSLFPFFSLGISVPFLNAATISLRLSDHFLRKHCFSSFRRKSTARKEK